MNGRQSRLLEEEPEEMEEVEEVEEGALAGGADADRHLAASYQGTEVTITVNAIVSQLSPTQQTTVWCPCDGGERLVTPLRAPCTQQPSSFLLLGLHGGRCTHTHTRARTKFTP